MDLREIVKLVNHNAISMIINMIINMIITHGMRKRCKKKKNFHIQHIEPFKL